MKTDTQLDPELQKALVRFMDSFEYIFDGEWNDFTKDLLYQGNVDSYIHPQGTLPESQGR